MAPAWLQHVRVGQTHAVLQRLVPGVSRDPLQHPRRTTAARNRFARGVLESVRLGLPDPDLSATHLTTRRTVRGAVHGLFAKSIRFTPR